MNRVEAARELAVPLGASAGDVERAFRHVARRCHPDVGGDAHAFRRAIEARSALLAPWTSDPVAWVVATVVRHHPAVRILDALSRAWERGVRW